MLPLDRVEESREDVQRAQKTYSHLVWRPISSFQISFSFPLWPNVLKEWTTHPAFTSSPALSYPGPTPLFWVTSCRLLFLTLFPSVSRLPATPYPRPGLHLLVLFSELILPCKDSFLTPYWDRPEQLHRPGPTRCMVFSPSPLFLSRAVSMNGVLIFLIVNRNVRCHLENGFSSPTWRWMIRRCCLLSLHSLCCGSVQHLIFAWVV